MKKFIIATLAASILATPVLAAPGGDNSNDRGRYSQQDHRGDRNDRGDHNDRSDRNRHDDRGGQRFGQNDSRGPRSGYGGYQGQRPNIAYRQWNRGDRFDYRYANNYRVISTPYQYRLHDAPRGYRWVQSGNDAVLIGLASGVVAAVLAGAIN